LAKREYNAYRQIKKSEGRTCSTPKKLGEWKTAGSSKQDNQPRYSQDIQRGAGTLCADKNKITQLQKCLSLDVFFLG
jgi:hypothetical protein